jgi:hypothetical protein
VTERWETIEAINAARDAMADRLGWEQPAAWGLLTPDGAVVRANVRTGYLPGVVLATVVGHRHGSASYALTPAAIAEAIALAEPAEACTDIPHPNIAALRVLSGGEAVVAFVSEGDFVEDAEGFADKYVSSLVGEIRRGRQENADGTTTLWRPVGPAELGILREGGFKAWPPRLPDQPIFYPVLNEQYAATIARDWNVSASGSGYVTRFRVATSTARKYATQTAGGPEHLELWVPAEELDDLNAALVGEIEVIAEFGARH